MSIVNDIQVTNETDSRGLTVLAIGTSRVLVGDHLGTYDDDADEATGYPVSLVDGSTIADCMDRDELRSMLRALGFGVETDDTGLVLVQRGGA